MVSSTEMLVKRLFTSKLAMIHLSSKLATSSANENEPWTVYSWSVKGDKIGTKTFDMLLCLYQIKWAERRKEAKAFFVQSKHDFAEKLFLNTNDYHLTATTHPHPLYQTSPFSILPKISYVNQRHSTTLKLKKVKMWKILHLSGNVIPRMDK